MYLEGYLRFIGMGLCFFVGIIIGAVIGFISFDYWTKKDMALQVEKKDKKIDISFKPRLYPQQMPTDAEAIDVRVLSEIRAPQLDSAGVATEEEDRFFAHITSISTRGATIMSERFLPIGLVVEIACKEKGLSFAFRRAEVRNHCLTKRGLQIGLQFIEPFKKMPAGAMPR